MERQAILNCFYNKSLEIRTGRSIKRGELPESNTSRDLDLYSKYISDMTDSRIGLNRLLESMSNRKEVWLDVGCGDASAIYQEFSRTWTRTCCECVGITAKKTGFYFEYKSNFDEFHKSPKIKIIQDTLSQRNNLKRVVDKKASAFKNRIALITSFNSLIYFDSETWISTLRDVQDLLIPGGNAFIDIQTHAMYRGKFMDLPENLEKDKCVALAKDIFPNVKFTQKSNTQMNDEYITEDISIWVTKGYKTS